MSLAEHFQQDLLIPVLDPEAEGHGTFRKPEATRVLRVVAAAVCGRFQKSCPFEPWRVSEFSDIDQSCFQQAEK